VGAVDCGRFSAVPVCPFNNRIVISGDLSHGRSSSDLQ
jgi:hypothetical protein